MKHQFCPYCMTPVEDGKPCGACGLTQGSYTPSPHHLPPGTVLKERYLVGRVLGEGGFGITYIGCDLQLELKVAIKEYFPTDKASRMSQASLDVASYTGAAGVNYDKGLEKFLQEARTIARMDKQPVIVNVRDFFQVNHTAYIVMEYVEGTTFKELVEQRGGRIPAGELLYLIEPLFFALKEMHGNGLIHRDISPENLMLEKGEVRLLDFGCARESSDGGNTLTIALKHGYAPVEQYQSKGQGPWTDVYALSATIYYCLTGKKPPQAMDRLVEDELVPPRKLGIDLTQQQEKALLYGMGVPPKRRFQGMEEFHTALYEGFVPNAENEAHGQKEPTGTGTDGAPNADGGDRTVEAGNAGETPARSFGLMEWLKKNRLLAGGVSAALALVILLAAVLPRVLGPGQAEGPDPAVSQDQPGASGMLESEQPPAPIDRTFSPEKSDVENGAVLLSLLADDGVGTVTIPGNVNVRVDKSVELTKLLRIEGAEYGNVYFPCGLTVGSGGRLQTWSDVNAPALLRTMDGGTISVESGGQLYSCMMWLEQAGDLTAAPDGTVNVWGSNDPTKGPLDSLYAYSHYMVLDEEALFANAVQVSSEAEFAAVCQGEAPIVVNGEITFTGYHCATTPILIPEGAVLNAPCGEDGDCTLDVDCAILVNHGTIRGRVSLVDFSMEERQANPRLVNYGTVEAELNSFAGNASTIVNYGQIAFDGGPRLDQAAISNLGRMVASQGKVGQAGNMFLNAGACCVSGGMWTINGGSFHNFGSVTVEQAGRLINRGDFQNEIGTLDVFPGAALENYNTLDIAGGTFTLGGNSSGNGVFINEGILMHGVDSLNFSYAASVSGDGHVIPFSYYDEQDDSVRHVENERDLRQALVNPAVDLVIWDGYQDNNWIEVTGDGLEITKGVILNAPGNGQDGTIHGNVTVTGENAFLIPNNIVFASGLRVENGATVLYSGGDDPRLGSLTVDSGGLYVSTVYMSVNGSVTLSGGGRLVNSGEMEVYNSGVAIGEGSAIENYAWLGLKNCTVANDGKILAGSGLGLDGGSLANHGELRFACGGEIKCRAVNGEDGIIIIEGTDPHDCPVLRGTLDNQGTIRVAVGGDLNVDGGRVTGNLIQYEG